MVSDYFRALDHGDRDTRRLHPISDYVEGVASGRNRGRDIEVRGHGHALIDGVIVVVVSEEPVHLVSIGNVD